MQEAPANDNFRRARPDFGPADEALVRERQLDSMIAVVLKEQDAIPVGLARVARLKKIYDLVTNTSELAEMEARIRDLPPSWKQGDTAEWFALASSLRERRDTEAVTKKLERAKHTAQEALDFLAGELHEGTWVKDPEVMSDRKYLVDRLDTLDKLLSVIGETTEDDWKINPPYYYLVATEFLKMEKARSGE
jgi:hypothetical protein